MVAVPVSSGDEVGTRGQGPSFLAFFLVRPSAWVRPPAWGGGTCLTESPIQVLGSPGNTLTRTQELCLTGAPAVGLVTRLPVPHWISGKVPSRRRLHLEAATVNVPRWVAPASSPLTWGLPLQRWTLAPRFPPGSVPVDPDSWTCAIPDGAGPRVCRGCAFPS